LYVEFALDLHFLLALALIMGIITSEMATPTTKSPNKPTKSTDKSAAEIYFEALTESLAELSDLMEEIERIDERREEAIRRVFRLRHGALGLAALCGRKQLAQEFPELFPDDIAPDTGLTDAVRDVLKSNDPVFCSPVYIRDTLKEKGFDLSKYTNALASIHTVLKRLVRQGDAVDASRDGRTVYRWAKKKQQQEEALPELSDEDIPF